MPAQNPGCDPHLRRYGRLESAQRSEIAPEGAIALEVVGSIDSFHSAAQRVPVFAFLGEEDTTFAPGEDFALLDVRGPIPQGAHELDRLIADITVDAYGDGEKLSALLQAFEDGVDLPCGAFVIGEPVSLVEFDYDGSTRREILARCQREDGSEHSGSASEVTLAPHPCGRQILGAYCKRSGLEPLSDQVASSRIKGAGRRPP